MMCLFSSRDCMQGKEFNYNYSKFSAFNIEKGFSLIVGAGVTSCLVGSWDNLLEQIALNNMPSVCMPPVYLEEYIKNNRLTRVAKGTDVLEKGEYLSLSKENAYWNDRDREKAFAYKVYSVVCKLIKDKLISCRLITENEAKNMDSIRDLFPAIEKDFISWINNDDMDFCGLTRKDVSNDGERFDEKKRFLVNKPCIGFFERKHFVAYKILDYLIKNKKTGLDSKILLWGKILEIANTKVVLDKNSFDCINDKVDEVINNFVSKHKNIILLLSDKEYKKKIKGLYNFSKKIDDSTHGEDKELQEMAQKISDNDKNILVFLALLLEEILWKPNYRTLEAVVKMCLEHHVKTVINYNFDTILDRLLSSEKIQEKYPCKFIRNINVYNTVGSLISVFSTNVYHTDGSLTQVPPTNNSSNDEKSLFIYHVHGILDDDYQFPINPIIFNSTSYDIYQDNPLNAGNRCLAEVLSQDQDVLCIGFSGTDNNFRVLMSNIVKQEHRTLSNDRYARVYIAQTWEEKLMDVLPQGSSDLIPACTLNLKDSKLKETELYYDHTFHVRFLWWRNFYDMGCDLFDLNKLRVKSNELLDERIKDIKNEFLNSNQNRVSADV